MVYAELRGLIDLILPGLGETYLNLFFYTFGILIYAVLIFHFYRFVAQRDVFGLDLSRYKRTKEGIISKVFNKLLGMFKYGVVFPIFVFFWFTGFSLLMFFLAKNTSTEQILLISITVVSAARITSYYSEELSRDLAKMLPFALLGIAIVEPAFFSMELVWERIASVFAFVPQIIQFALFLVLLEWLLRIILNVKHFLLGISKSELKEIKEKLEDEEVAEPAEEN